MNLLKALNKRFGAYAIPGLIYYIVMLTGLVTLISLIFPEYILQLILLPTEVYSGEFWRILTFIIVPPPIQVYFPQFYPFFLFFYLYLLYIYGKGLEQEWGIFKFNCYYFLGLFLHILVCFITGIPLLSAGIHNIFVMLAFAKIYPDFVIYFFFILPVKIKYLALLIWIIFIAEVITEPWAETIYIVVGMINYVLFFGPSLFRRAKSKSMSMAASRRRNRTAPAEDKPFHCCAVCGLTENDDPEIDFRVCDECENGEEYCEDHIENHEHHRKQG